MTQFPEPVPIPDNVFEERMIREKQVIQASKRGVAIRFSVILFELFGFYIFSSSALLLDALASCLDVLGSLFLIFCIKMASKPPDREHPFGHGRYEPLAGLQLGVFLIIIGGFMLLQQSFQLSELPSGHMDPRAWVVPLVATLLLEGCYRIVMRTSIKQHSPALAADAAHYRIDALTSLFATVALLFGAAFPDWSFFFDHVGAISISLVMIVLGLLAAKSNMNQLMDKTPEPSFFNRVKQAALSVTGVFGTEKIRIQQFGPDAHVDIDIEVDPNLSVLNAHTISQKVRSAIQKEWSSVRDVIVHIEPFYPNDHQ